MRCAVSSSGGSSSRRTASLEARLACAETLTAATTRPPRRGSAPRSSAGPPRAPGRPAPSPARGRGRARRAAASALSIARAVSGADLRAREVGVERRRERGQQDAAHRGRVGREARADVDRDAHDARGGDAADVDDLVAVEHRHRAGLADLRREPLEVRLGDLGQAQARQVRVAELEHARGEREVLAVAAHVAEVDQREQEAARGRAREVRAAGDVGERQLRVVGAERADDREAALQGLDEVTHSSVVWAIAIALLAAGTPA